MAEERIYVFKFTDDPCKNCEVKALNPDCGCCCVEKKEYSCGITRQEAIERMAKAFVNLYIEIEGTGVTYTAKEVAEAALNALLEADHGGH